MSKCVECEGTIKVNYSCYSGSLGDTYICNDCEQEYYNGNYEIYSLFPAKPKNLI